MHTNNIFELEDGFYHRTEDDDMIGPFTKLEHAQIAYNEYIKWLQHDHEHEIHKMRDYYE